MFGINNTYVMNHMFAGCSALNELNINNFRSKNLKNKDNIFYLCSKELKVKIKDRYMKAGEASLFLIDFRKTK